MNSEEKIEYMLRKIREAARISPLECFSVSISPFVDIESSGGVPDDAPVLFSRQDQVNCLLKFKKDGLLSDVAIGKYDAMVALGSLNKNSEENPYKQKIEDPNILMVSVWTGELVLNKRTGCVRLNKVEKEFNPSGREFKAILALATAKDNLVTFKELFGDYKRKGQERDLGFILRDLKKGMGILPKKRSKNKDIIKSVMGYGYRLITPQNLHKQDDV